jgi:hypothetical protein
MTTTTATHEMPPAIITHSVAAIRGEQKAGIDVYYARTPDARMSVSFGGVLMVFYNCQAVQGLLEAFTAARGHSAMLPEQLPAPRAGGDEPVAHTTVSIEWTRRPNFAAVAQSGPNRLKSAHLHWVDLHVGPVTWQIRDRIALRSTIEMLADVHKTAIAVFNDGEKYSADPTANDYRAA